MTGLKTLKDLSFNSQVILEGKNLQLVWESRLKEEAIKWVKYGRKFKVEPKEEQWLAFFNLTEEDLK